MAAINSCRGSPVGRLNTTDDLAFEWGASQRGTSVSYNFTCASESQKTGFPLTCIWSAKRLGRRSKLEIDHCFPWSRWPNNDLWNLLPTSAAINRKKRDRLPGAETLAEAQQRMIHWWDSAWVDTPHDEQFFMEANYALPGLSNERPSLKEIHEATQHQRVRLKQDQQIPEWLHLNRALNNPRYQVR